MLLSLLVADISKLNLNASLSQMITDIAGQCSQCLLSTMANTIVDSKLGGVEYRSVNFEMSFWSLQIDQKSNEIFIRISAINSKKRSNQKIRALYTTPFFIGTFFKARAEIMGKNSLFFWKI